MLKKFMVFFVQLLGVFSLFISSRIKELLRTIRDPEHPVTLEQLKVISVEHVKVDDANSNLVVEFTPTVAHCTLATLIGLCIRIKLQRLLPKRFKVTILLTQGSHSTEEDGI